MNGWQPVGFVLAMSVVVMVALWAHAQRTRNASFVDVAWSYLMGVAAIIYGLTGDGAWLPRLVVGVLAALWGARLGTHLFVRLYGEAEDGRYAHMRRAIGNHGGKWLAFFLGQALVATLFSLPFFVVANNPVGEVTPWFVLGVAIWVTSVVGEAIADAQLAAFKREPRNRGRVCDVGLWRYSRHPNYFFEWLHWFSYVALAVGAPLSWLTWLGPVLMLLSLLFVTGIPFVEQQSLRSRGEAYRHYQRTTSMFVPWFPRRA